MDFTGFIVVLLGLLTNPLGIVDGMEDVLATARDLADEGQLRARQLLGRHLARPMRTLVFICGAVLLAAVLLVSYLHFAVLGWTGWSTLGLVAYAAVTVAGIIIALLVAQRQVAIIEDPGDDPINARNRLTGYVLIAAIAVSSIALSLLALGTESRSLWLVSMLVRYAGIGVIAAIAIVLSWVVRKGVGFFEKALQFIVEPLAALAPGITLKNASEKLFGGKLNIVDEDFVGDKITAAASALMVLCIPFDTLVFLNPTYGMAEVVGGAYVISLITGYLAMKVGKGDVVQKSTERLAVFLFSWAKVVAAVVIIGWAAIVAVVPEHTRAAIDIQSWVASLWVSRFIAGDVGICGGYSVWMALGYLPIAGIIAYAVYHFTEEMKDGWKGRTKAGLRVITSLLVLHSLVVALVAFGIWGNPVKGVTLQSSVVQPKVDVEEIAIQSMDATADAPTVDARENVVKLSWTTNGPSDCRVEIARIAYKGKEVEHAYLKEGTMLQAVANVPRTAHHLFLNDLALGMTVVYRIHVTGLEDAQRGVTTVTREFNVSPAPPKLADAKKDEPKPEPSETPSATPSVPPAGPTVGRRNVKQRERLAVADTTESEEDVWAKVAKIRSRLEEQQ